MDARRGESGLFIRVDYPDDDLRKRIESFLRSRHFSALRNLEVSVAGGVATLKGEVGSFYEKQVALDACRRVAGVLCTVDQMQVEQRLESAVPSRANALAGIKAGHVTPGGSTSRVEFPLQSGVGSF
ncbi:MAG: BON domain-containing protein [Planctomycetota bacterium]